MNTTKLLPEVREKVLKVKHLLCHEMNISEQTFDNWMKYDLIPLKTSPITFPHNQTIVRGILGLTNDDEIIEVKRIEETYLHL